MQTAATSQDMSQFTSFLLDDIPTSSDTHVAQQPEAHEPIILQDLLQTLYFVRVDQHWNISYFENDMNTAPTIDRAKQTITFTTKIWITKTFDYDRDDTQEEAYKNP